MAAGLNELNETTTIEEVVCTVCGCLCDDLTLETAAGRVTKVSPPCVKAEESFLAERNLAPCIRVDGEAASLDEAASHAAEILSLAQTPLVMGLQRATTEAQRVAIGIADAIGATIDPTDDRGHSQNHVAVQTVGAVSASLGEAANRADLVVYWRCDPDRSHPRHRQRFAANAERVIVVDCQRTATADQVDEFIQIDDQLEFECLWALRAIVRGRQSVLAQSASLGGDLLRRIGGLAERLQSAKYAAVFFEPQQGVSGGPSAIAQAIYELVADLHRTTRAVALRLGRPANAVGAWSALTWQTGFPSAVSFRNGYPEYLPGDGDAARRIARGEVDAALVVGADRAALDRHAAAGRDRIPVITINDRQAVTAASAAVEIVTAPFGLGEKGSVSRSDGVSLPLGPVIDTALPSCYEALAAIASEIARLADAQA